MLNDRGSKLAEPFAQQVGVFDVQSRLLPVQVKGYWGFSNPSGILRIEPEFEEVSVFKDRSAYVKKEGLWGVVDLQGKYLIKPQYKAYRKARNGKRQLYNP